MSDRTPMKSAGLPGSRTSALPPPKKRSSTPLTVAPDPATPTPTAGTQPKRSSAPTTPRRTPRKASDDAQVANAAVSLSLPVDLARDLQQRAHRDHSSQVDVVLDALEAAGDRLDDLVATYQQARQGRGTITSGRFVRRAPAQPQPLHTSLSLRMDRRNLDVIDQLAAPHGPRSRSLVCAAALTDYLQAGS